MGEPTITIQLPIYNEKYVAERLVDAVCELDYPKEKMKIMVLDDSADSNTTLLHQQVQKYQKIGIQIEHGLYKSSFLYGDGSAGKKISDLLSSVPLSVEKRITY